MKCVVDTSIINRLIDGSLSTDDIPADAELIATHIQSDELNKTRDEERRAQLFLRFATTVAVIPTESFVLGASRFGYGKFSDGSLYDKLKTELDSLNKEKANNVQDALIAEVAIATGYTLLTADRDLAKAAKKYGGTVLYFTP